MNYKSIQKSLVLPISIAVLFSNYSNSFLVIICSPNEEKAQEVKIVGTLILNINGLMLEWHETWVIYKFLETNKYF